MDEIPSRQWVLDDASNLTATSFVLVCSMQQLEAADEDPVEFIIRPGSGVSMDSYGFYGWGIYS